MNQSARSPYHRLRRATRTRHEAIEKLDFFVSLTNHDLPKQSAVSYLRGMAVIHSTLETSLLRTAGADFGPWHQRCRRLDDLLATLANAGVAELPDIPGAVEASIDLADRILLDSGEVTTLLGYLYVLEGSQLGGQLLRRHFAAALGVEPDQVRYYTRDRRTLQTRWSKFRQQLDALELDEQGLEPMLEAARACFNGIGELARSCFPFESSELRHRITAINPEAGRHAMPRSEAEVTRALRCAQRAWLRFPYLDARYGERGRRFTRSDSCWLVALYDLEAPLVAKSLFWLRKVLSSRGLPTVILETHLEMIDRDIEAEDPGRARQCKGFRTVISRFRAERDAIMPPAVRGTMTSQYQAQFDQCLGDGIPGAAEILIDAAIDTAIGIEHTQHQVFSWVRDRERFTETWVSTVDRLAEDLAANAGVKKGVG